MRRSNETVSLEGQGGERQQEGCLRNGRKDAVTGGVSNEKQIKSSRLFIANVDMEEREEVETRSRNARLKGVCASERESRESRFSRL